LNVLLQLLLFYVDVRNATLRACGHVFFSRWKTNGLFWQPTLEV